jgi:hypothetical protein
MIRHSFYLVISAAVLVGFVGAARAEVSDAPLSSQARAKADRPAPVSRPSHAGASHRILERTPAATVLVPRAEPGCDGFACGQFLIVGIGF